MFFSTGRVHVNLAIWAARSAAQMAKNRSAHSACGMFFSPCRVHVGQKTVPRAERVTQFSVVSAALCVVLTAGPF
jgi:hypothetical protein